LEIREGKEQEMLNRLIQKKNTIYETYAKNLATYNQRKRTEDRNRAAEVSSIVSNLWHPRGVSQKIGSFWVNRAISSVPPLKPEDMHYRTATLKRQTVLSKIRISIDTLWKQISFLKCKKESIKLCLKVERRLHKNRKITKQGSSGLRS